MLLSRPTRRWSRHWAAGLRLLAWWTVERATSNIQPDVVEALPWGVEPRCAVLSEHGIPVAPSTDDEWIDKQPTKQQLHDKQVTALIRKEPEDPRTGTFASGLGARTMWLRLRGGHDVATCTVERLMCQNGWEDTASGRKHVTTVGDPKQPRHPDLANRNVSPARPNRLGVADVTYYPSWTGRFTSRSSSTPTPAGSSGGESAGAWELTSWWMLVSTRGHPPSRGRADLTGLVPTAMPGGKTSARP